MAEINRTAIEQRAHKIWIARGRRDGQALEDWVQAEVELRAEAARGAKPAGTAPSAGKPAAPAFGAAKPAATFGGAKPAATTSGGNLAQAPGAPSKGGAPAAGSAAAAGGLAGTVPVKNGNRPSKNGRGKKK
jgi:hypothetical protein